MYVRREIFVEGQGGEPSSFRVQGGTKTLKGSAKSGGGGPVNIAGPPTPESGEAMAPPAPPVPTPMSEAFEFFLAFVIFNASPFQDIHTQMTVLSHNLSS